MKAPTARDESANGARYESQGQARSASPLVRNNKAYAALKGRNSWCVFRPFRPRSRVVLVYQGRRAPLRFALAPGFHISRRWRYKRRAVGAFTHIAARSMGRL